MKIIFKIGTHKKYVSQGNKSTKTKLLLKLKKKTSSVNEVHKKKMSLSF